MSDDAKIDKLLEHVLEIKVTLAELKGERLPERVERLEGAVHEHDKRWSKVAGVSAVAGALGGGLLATLLKKVGFAP